jgi:hypothetical protein
MACFKIYLNLLPWIKENYENISMEFVSALCPGREADSLSPSSANVQKACSWLVPALARCLSKRGDDRNATFLSSGIDDTMLGNSLMC